MSFTLSPPVLCLHENNRRVANINRVACIGIVHVFVAAAVFAFQGQYHRPVTSIVFTFQLSWFCLCYDF